MENPNIFFDKLVAQTVFRPVPQAAVEKFPDSWTQPANIVTSGAFKLKTWAPQDQIVIERNPNFWDHQNTKLEKIIFTSPFKKTFMSEELLDVENYYQKGEADVLLVLKSHSKTFEGKKDFFRTKYLGTTFLHLNLTLKPFDDIRVREALNLALDREKLNKVVTFPSHSFTPEIKDYQNPKIEGFNPTEARRLLAEAGYPNGKSFPELEFIFYDNKRDNSTVEFIQAEWQRELGIKVNLKGQEFKDFVNQRKEGKYRGVAVGTWAADYPDPNSFLSSFAEKNYSGWVDDHYNQLLTNANAEIDAAKRYEMLIEAEKYLLEQKPLIPLYNQVNRLLCKPYVKNLNVNPLGQINWREVYIDQDITADRL